MISKEIFCISVFLLREECERKHMRFEVVNPAPLINTQANLIQRNAKNQRNTTYSIH